MRLTASVVCASKNDLGTAKKKRKRKKKQKQKRGEEDATQYINRYKDVEHVYVRIYEIQTDTGVAPASLMVVNTPASTTLHLLTTQAYQEYTNKRDYRSLSHQDVYLPRV